jgi:hypothetical protein
MRLWNFSNFEQFEEQVLVGHDSSTQPSKASPKRKKGASRGPKIYSGNSSLKLAMAFATALAISIPVSAYGNSRTTQVSVSEITSPAINVAAHPPLEVLFGGRFQDEWTRDHEDKLLALAVDKASASPDSDRANFIHTAQQESIDGDVPRLQVNDLPKANRRKGKP